MVDRDDFTVFPVVLFDGEREINIGNIEIHPELDFKVFQSNLSKMIGISYNNLTTYFVDRKKSKLCQERRKILVTGKINFSQISRERDCMFLVVLKRSRRERRRKPRQSNLDEYFPASTPENFLLLRRNQPDLNNQQISVYGSPCYDDSRHQPDLNDQQNSLYGSHYYNDSFRDLQIQRENYINMIVNSNYGFDSPLNVNSFPKIKEAYSVTERNRGLCEECTDAKKRGKTASFHLCVYDSVITGFRSPVGPISRPFKGCGDQLAFSD